jgi:hypothetical protein
MAIDLSGAAPIAQESANPQESAPQQGGVLNLSGAAVLDPDQAAESQSDTQYGGAIEGAKALAEQAASGATLGASKVLETKLGITTPEAIAGREAEHPALSALGNVGGTAALIYGTGGLGGLGEGAGVLGKIGLGAAEGAGIGGVNQITDDWSQNKALDAQRIAASAGLGAILGGTGSALAEGASAAWKSFRGVKAELPETAGAGAPPVSPSETTGVQPTSIQDIVNRVSAAKADGSAVELPQQAVLRDSISRVPMENPVNPLQMDSLASQEARDVYGAAKEMPGTVGQALTNYEGLQKQELVRKVLGTIQDISPGADLTPDAVKGGQAAIDAFSDQYQGEKKALIPALDSFKTQTFSNGIDHLPGMVEAMTNAVPGVSNMFDTAGADISILPYKTSFGIDRVTYNAVKDAVESLQENPETVRDLLNIRNGLKQNVNALDQGPGASQIGAMGKSVLDYIQNTAENPEIRDVLRKYAINEQQRGVIEKSFGASVGSPEFGSISKIKPEYIGDKIFGNTATVTAAKSILPPEQFQKILANWMTEKMATVMDNGAFHSNKYASFLKNNQDALNVAFSDNPNALKRLHDLTTIMRILPDAKSINPSGTAKTLLRMVGDMKLHDMTWEGMLASIPQKAMGKIQESLQMRDLNQRLAGTAAKSNMSEILQKRASETSANIAKATKAIFQGAASESRKDQ